MKNRLYVENIPPSVKYSDPGISGLNPIQTH